MPTPSSLSQHEYDGIVTLAQSGDDAAFARLYELHQRQVYFLSLKIFHDREDAEDHVQDVFLHLKRRIGSFRGDSQFSTWLHRVAVNLGLMKLRKKNLLTISIDAMMEMGDGEVPQQFGVPDHRLEYSPNRVALQKALKDLPPGYRSVLILHDIEGFEHNEIAEILGCSTGNSKSQLHKGRMLLAKLLGAHIDPLAFLADFDKYLKSDEEQQQAS